MKAINLDEECNLYLTEDGPYNTRTHIKLSEKEDVVLVYHSESSLYPMWLPRETGKIIEKIDEYGNLKKEKEIVFDIYNNRCGWYIFDRKVMKDDNSV